jgi:hypothetical protein
VKHDRRGHQWDGDVRYVRRDPAGEVDVRDRAVVGAESFRDIGEWTPPAARRVDQGLASHDRTGNGRARIGPVLSAEESR